jgi:hypothetical protein
MSVFVWHDGSAVWRRRLARAGFSGGPVLPEERRGVLVCWRKDTPGRGGRSVAGFRRVLNDPAQAAMLRNDGRLRRKLVVHGVRFEPPDAGEAEGKNRPWLVDPGAERWEIGVFDMAVVGVRRSNGGRGPGAAGNGDSPRKLARLARYAVRTVYGAGLDFAVVTVRLEGARGAVLERLDPAPEPADEDWSPWRNALAALAAGAGDARQGEAVLGMDPEFVLLNESGKVVPASRFFAREGIVGCDNATVPGRSDTHPLAELRPAPDREPEMLIRGLRRAMWTAASHIADPGLKWVAGAMPVPGLPVGGHIHISGVPLNAALVRALDNYLALPLALLEDETAARRRKKYGRPGDVRVKSHGGFEYRTLPSVIASPRVTKGALALAKLVAEQYERLTERPLDDPDVLEAFAAGDKERLAPVAERLWKQIASLDGYAKYARFLDPLGEWMASGRTWRSDADIRKAWRIPPF